MSDDMDAKKLIADECDRIKEMLLLRANAVNERDVLQQCLQLLRLRGIPAWRNNTGSLPVGDRYVRFGLAGSSDIIGVLPGSGRFLAVETKGPRGRLRPAQRAFLDAITAAGGLALVVSDVRQLAAALDAEGV